MIDADDEIAKDSTPIDPHQAANSRGLKVHLRTFDIGRATFRVVSLRPATTARFSTNWFHDTWHLLMGCDGALVLGRLFWGLGFQRQPGTLVLIDHPHLVPTPFEADRPDPILLVPAGLTSINSDQLRALKVRLKRAPGSPKTIRWHTFGLPAALTAEDRGNVWRHDEYRSLFDQERMSKRAGFICYTAPPAILRAHGVGIYQMHAVRDDSYHPLADRDRYGAWRVDGEVQVLRDFDDHVSAAIVARRTVLGEDTVNRELSWDERLPIFDERYRAFARLRDARRP